MLADFIQSPNRRYPLIVFNGGSDAMIEEAEWLARQTTGKAQVAVITDNAQLANEFHHFIGKEYYVPFGFLRVFFPFNQRWNRPERHRWYDPQREEYEAQRNGILHGLLRNHVLAERGGVETVQDVAWLINRENLLKLKTNNPEQQATLNNFLEEHSKVAQERDSARSEAECYANEIDTLERENGELKFKVQGLQQRLEAAQAAQEVDASKTMRKLPSNLGEVAREAIRFFPRLDIAPQALETADEYGDCKCHPEAWEILVHLNDVLHVLKFERGEKDLEGAFRAKTGFSLAMSEGKMTKDDAKLMRLRKLIHNGKEFDISPHVKHGNQEPKLVRVHFAFDEERKKIVIGHIGRHIPNYTSKKM